jgi:hypothetical protein
MRNLIEACQETMILLILLSLGLVLSGCEDVIDLDLKTTEPRLVIEGQLSNIASENYFLISRTTDFYSPSEVAMVSGATIVVSDNVGNADTLTESTPGRYVFPSSTTAIAGLEYTASVAVEGQVYSASTTMPPAILIERMRFVKGEYWSEDAEEEVEGYQLVVGFEDAPARSDYVRFKVEATREIHPIFYLYDGRFTDGSRIYYEFYVGEPLFPGDIVDVRLYSMDEAMYDYFATLAEVWAGENEGGFFDTSPDNPTTNWSGGVLGYFGAFSIDEGTATVAE